MNASAVSILSHPQQTSTMIEKFVKWRTQGDGNCELYRYQNWNDSISIPTHPHNLLLQELYHNDKSESPYKIVFRYIGTNEESGETCRTFSHYSRVKCVDFTRRFTNVQSMFQVCSLFPAVKEILISINHENLLISKNESIQLIQYGIKYYNCASLKRLIVVIAKWDDMNPVALVPYQNLRLNVIVQYTKMCCPNIENIRVISEENDPNSSCFKALKLFREILLETFLDVSISWEPTKKMQPTSNGTGKEKKEYVSAVPENYKEAYVTKQEDPAERKLAPPTASPNKSGSNREDDQHSAQLPFLFSSTSESDRAGNAMTMCTESIHSVADMEQEDTSSKVHDPTLFIRHHNLDKRTPPLRAYNGVTTYKIPVIPSQNGRGRGRQKRIYENTKIEYDTRKRNWRAPRQY